MKIPLLKDVKDFSTMYLFRHGPYARSVDEFIIIAKKKYGSRYSYDRVVYRNSRTPVEITCKKHGPFSVTPDNFLKGKDCPRCRKECFVPSIVRDNFIAMVKKIYGKGKYDYSLVSYNSLDDPVTIICPEHGPYTTTPRKHLNSFNHCPRCMRNQPWNTGRFLKAARAVHGDTYDYSKIGVISGVRQKVTIICPQHGPFRQEVLHHITQGSGCPQCGRIKCGERQRMPFPEFLRRARKVHGDRYRYIEASYTTQSAPLTIVCPVHGEFSQNAEKHVMRGYGCPACGILRRTAKRTMTFQEFVKKARRVHKNKYQYIENTESAFAGNKTQAAIICPIHGEFKQMVNSHLSGCGCRKCGYETVSKKISISNRKRKKT
ncbi:MAG: DUF723 domain-containing protein [Treponema sp.]|jgi:hypothetical protein|nr:DUF723 domain-containing protein [Treponema sp.]